MKCPQCQSVNPDAQKYCGECGAQLEKICPVCDAGNPQEYKFCGECGNDLNPIGYFKLDRNGLIADVNPSGARMLGLIETAIVGKPFTLFITEDDLAEYFTYRNAVLSTGTDKACEIKLKKGIGEIDVHIESSLVGDGESNNQQLKLSVVDVSENRRALEALQYRQDLEKIFISLAGEMIRCPAREIDVAIDRTLETICLFTEIQHAYICELFDDKPGIKLTHEWYAPELERPSRKVTHLKIQKLENVIGRLKAEGQIIAAAMEEVPEKIQQELGRLNLSGTRSFVVFPMLFGEALIGLVGFDSLEERSNWPKDTTTLLEVACDAFLDIIIRQRDETAWYRKRREVLLKEAKQAKVKKTGGSAAKRGGKKKRTPVKVKAKIEGPADPKDGNWVFQKETVKDLSGALKVYEKGNNVLITCPNCVRRKEIVSPDIDNATKTMRVKCPCGYEFVVVVELRTVFRKQVNLEGTYILTGSGKQHSDSMSHWGTAWIRNISKSGIGFVTSSRQTIKPGDELKVKFNLDNTSESTIHKNVVVKSVDGDYVACQFMGTDKYDVTLGFYLM